jgi:helicase
MKYNLPEQHGLSESIVEKLVFKEDDKPALTDAQYEALQAGVGRGKSVLVVSPTSTGKTQIALWAIAKSIENGYNAVYLVTHRALAKQKFEDFKSLLLPTFLDSNGSALVIATGDYVENADGDMPAEPLGAPLLVATYEKYLALLSASGIPTDMGSTAVICDEIQLIGDEHRGQNVEVLLTLVRNAGWRQFVGLSAILESQDSKDLASWLDVTLVLQHTREKHLQYECWTPAGIAQVMTESPDDIQEGIPLPDVAELNPLSILDELLKQRKPPTPIIVFCMRKQDTYDLAKDFLDKYVSRSGQSQLSIVFDDLPETSANIFLAEALAQRIAIHNADLMDEERNIVEQQLLGEQLSVVFATSTLAAGVNFPLGAAVFASWVRWDSGRRLYEPIETGEFHNMAGRVGRMGYGRERGRIIFIAKSKTEASKAKKYLKIGTMVSLEPRISPDKFNQLALQLVASGLCKSENAVHKLICRTFSALREQERDGTAFKQWTKHITEAVEGLLNAGLLIRTKAGALVSTPVGRAVGQSGLLPETGVYLLTYISKKAETLNRLLPRRDSRGDIIKLAFLLFCACFSAPEFRPYNRRQPTRFLPFPLSSEILFDAEAYIDDLPDPIWRADPIPINAAKLSLDWMEGVELRDLESALPQLRAGMLRDMYRNLVWALQGLASITAAAADARTPTSSRPKVLHSTDINLDKIRVLPRFIRRLSYRIAEGLPDDVLWMSGLNKPKKEFSISRSEILNLRRLGYVTPEKIMLGSTEADKVRIKVFERAKPSPKKKAYWLRDTCRNWKIIQRKQAAEKHLKRARRCKNSKLIEEFYRSKGLEFEQVLEKIMGYLKIKYEKLDDKTKTGAPDYLIELRDSPQLILELKSREGDKLLDYNRSVEVLSASEIHGYKDTFCVTLCHPGVDPSVPLVIAACGRLSVVESSDLGEGLLRLCEGSLNQHQLWQWLASPGQAITADLPFRDYA